MHNEKKEPAAIMQRQNQDPSTRHPALVQAREARLAQDDSPLKRVFSDVGISRYARDCEK